MAGAVESRGGVSQWEQQAKTLLRSSLHFQLCRSVPSAGWTWHNWQLTKPYNCHVDAHDEQHEHEKGTDFIGVELAGARSAKRKQGEADGSNDAKGVPAKTSRLSSRRNADKTSGKSDSVICSTAGDVSQPNDAAKVPFTCPLCACASQDTPHFLGCGCKGQTTQQAKWVREKHFNGYNNLLRNVAKDDMWPYFSSKGMQVSVRVHF